MTQVELKFEIEFEGRMIPFYIIADYDVSNLLSSGALPGRNHYKEKKK